ncbi:MAG: phenylalanine--tRNA ligase subunit beta [Candidatus Paceibacterota bacterium]
MKYSYNWLKDLIGFDLEPEKLATLLTEYSFEVEEVVERDSDVILDIDILPNRASDCLSHRGIAREIVTILRNQNKEVELEELDTEFNSHDFKSESLIEVEVKSDECSRYSAKVVKVEVGESPDWVKQRLRACGLQPINNIVDVANYVMLETGQPLHAFDLDKIKGEKLIVRQSKGGEEITTLDDETYELDKDLVIADKEGPVAIAGIKGGAKARVDKDTDKIVLEAANFDPISVRKTTRNLKLRTDASWRFENEIDSNLTEKGVERTTALLENVAEGKASSDMVDYYPEPRTSHNLQLNPDYVRELLGVDVSDNEIIETLESLSFKVSGDEELEVEIPTFRLDVNRQEDLIEEVGRIYGYQNIEPEFSSVSMVAERNDKVFWKLEVKDILRNSNFFEAYNYSFISEEQAQNYNLSNEQLTEVANPVSRNFKYLRPSLIPNLIKNTNKNSQLPEHEITEDEINFFEIGQVFADEEKTMLGGTIASLSDSAFYEVKGVVSKLLESLGISDVWYDDYEADPDESIEVWNKAKSAEIKVDEEEIGYLGLISPELFKDDINELAAFEINFDKLQKLAIEEQEYQPISRYPSAVRDLAVLVPQSVKVADLMNKINSVGGSLVRDIDLFDIYQGDELPTGKKNLAFHIIYQSEEKTLEAEEIDKLQEEIINTLEENPEWEVRK